jgi:hypothetical protein
MRHLTEVKANGSWRLGLRQYSGVLWVVFDTSGNPEIITVGLRPETAEVALNEAAKLLRTGTDVSRG